MGFEMTLRENLLLMALVREYRTETARNQRQCRAAPGFKTDLFWVDRNRIARHLYRRLTAAA